MKAVYRKCFQKFYMISVRDPATLFQEGLLSMCLYCLSLETSLMERLVKKFKKVLIYNNKDKNEQEISLKIWKAQWIE